MVSYGKIDGATLNLKSVKMNKEVIDLDLGSVRNSSWECHNILVVEWALDFTIGDGPVGFEHVTSPHLSSCEEHGQSLEDMCLAPVISERITLSA